MKIEIEFKPIEDMRYATVGDFFYKEDGTLKFEVADTGDAFFNKLVLLHEICEQALTEKLGITEEEIMNFDLEFEKNRKEGNLDEPGFSPLAPYHREHTIATAVEMQMCAHVNQAWNDYDKHINEM